MTHEFQIFLVALFPLIYLTSFPIGTFHLLKAIDSFFGIFDNRVNFLRGYLLSIGALTAASFYGYFELLRASNLCDDEFRTFAVAGFPLVYFIVVPGQTYTLVKVINHFFKFWDSDEKLLEIDLAVLYTVSLISFITFFIVVRVLDYCV